MRACEMKIGKILTVECPTCKTGLWYWQVKSQFNCNTCNTKLRSNQVSAIVLAWMVCIFLLPFFLFIANIIATKVYGRNVGYLEGREILAYLEFGAFALIYPRMLRISKDEQIIGSENETIS